MYYIISLLFTIVIILFFLYKKISAFIAFIEDELTHSYSSNSSYNIKYWFQEIGNKLYEINEKAQNIDFALNCENPAGDNSAHSKRLNTLVKLYSNKLKEKLNLSENEAISRSAFEFSAFDNDRLIDKIEGRYLGSGWNDNFDNKKKIKNAFLKTGLLTKDCTEELQKLIPHDLCLPVWILFNKSPSNLDIVNRQFIISGDEKSYADYVKNRAIVLKLLKLGIIAKDKPTRKNVEEKSGDFWLDWPCIKFLKSDLEEIKSIIYKGNIAHDDAHFEEKFTESKQAHFFEDFSSVAVEPPVTLKTSEIDEANKLNDYDAREHFKKGEKYRKLKNNDLALDEFSMAIKLKPDFIEAYWERGYLNRDMGNESGAEYDFAKVKEFESKTEN
jgi:tetratricopeptide (TPR) repeat protein